MITNDGGYSAYASEASEINNNIERFRSDIDNVRLANKQIKEQFQSKIDLDNLSNLGAELGAKATKDIAGKVLGKIYTLKGYGGRSIRDWDIENTFQSDDVAQTLVDAVRKGGKDLTDFASNFASKQVKSFTDFLDKQKEMNEINKFDYFVKQRTGAGVDDAISNKNVFDSIELDNEAIKPTNLTSNLTSNLTELKGSLDEGVKGAIDKVNTNVSDMVISAGDSSGKTIADSVSNVAKDVGSKITEEAGASVADEAIGSVLDTTGVGALIGVPLQIAGLVADGGLLYEAGKSLVDWFDEDILGHKPQVPKNQLVATPTRPLTLADRGLAVVPNIDTIDTQPSYSGGW